MFVDITYNKLKVQGVRSLGSISLRRRRPGPPAKLAAAMPIRCFAACVPE